MKTIKKIPMKEKKKIIEAILITLMLMMIVKHRLSQAHTLQLGHRVTEPLLEADEQELPPPPKHRLSSHGLLSPAPSRRGSMRKDEKVSILSHEIPLSSNSSYGQPVLNAPPSPYGPMNQSVSTASASPSKAKPASEKVSPYLNTAYRKSSKLAALEASGSNNYVLGTSPSVGKFQRSRTVKEKKQGPTCKEGDAIKEGQVIAYLHQLGKELHVTIIQAQTNVSISSLKLSHLTLIDLCYFWKQSDVAGEVLKLLSDVGGYGEPLVAVLPSFHDINIQ